VNDFPFRMGLEIQGNGPIFMNRNMMNIVVGCCVIAATTLGYFYYLEQQKTSGIDITIGDNKISIETK
jgi:hypothetical protein